MRNQLSKLDDRTLVRSFITGNDESFTVLLNRHKSKIFTTVYLIVKDRDLAEDIFQDVMIKVVKMIRQGKYNEEGKFLPWVVRIARNLAIDHFRKDQRSPIHKGSDKFDIFDTIKRTDLNVEEAMIKDEKARYLRKLIHQLPEKQRDVLIMRHYGELSFKEISALSGVSINTSLGRMRYALINLRKMMEIKETSKSNERIQGI